jgi:thiamine-monophosphate kinase
MAFSTPSPAMTAPLDEFAWIDRLRPLTRGDDRALGLMDDAAVIPGRRGFELVVSKDAMVEGVHFLAGEAPDMIARRLLRTNLSDLAAKAAEPFGYFLMTAWPDDRPEADREAFIRGLAADGEGFGVALLGGDTVRTPGPMTLCATVLGWSPEGRTVRRSGARAGDIAVVVGVIGDGWLGLRAALGEVADPAGALAAHYRAPRPLLEMRDGLRRHASAAADVSDGLLADAAHVAEASGLALGLELGALPLSAGADAWLAAQPDPAVAVMTLATGGDDYALICAARPGEADALMAASRAVGLPAARLGVFAAGAGLTVTVLGRPMPLSQLGWRH